MQSFLITTVPAARAAASSPSPSPSPPTRVVTIFNDTSFASAAASVSFRTANVAFVPGHPANPRTLSCSLRALSSPSQKSSSLSSTLTLAACDASPYDSCGVVPASNAAAPLHTSGNASTSALAPRPNSSSSSSGCFSSPSSGRSILRSTGPASILSTVYATETPVTSTPASSARCTGAAPRNCGNRLGWMFSVPRRGMSRKRCGRKLPYAAVTIRSTSIARSVARKSSSFALTGHKIKSSGTPRVAASAATGDGGGGPLDFRPRPRGRPGWDTTAWTSNAASGVSAASNIALSAPAATSGVPRNTRRCFRAPPPSSSDGDGDDDDARAETFRTPPTPRADEVVVVAMTRSGRR
mmetsp:Transcript_5676/g.20629  ORF Transcript_5676/g.20629 Transcript_5676/m.20629 type:complete len:354 (-) Transcript_5676:97-1158(-)